MFYVLEQIEDNIAVLISDGKQTVNVDVSFISEGAKIGDVLVFDDEKYVLDADETQKRKERIISKHRSLFKK